MKVEFHPQDVGITVKPPIAKEPFPTYDESYEVTPTTEAQTLSTKDKYMAGNVTINAVQQGIVMPYAVKGSVTNNSVAITPKAQVTQGGGWISGGTHTGINEITVSASELVSGSKTITENGTVDVTNYASAVVNVQPSGDINITQNGTFDVADFANAIVNVAGSGGFEYETGTFTPTSNIAQPTIQFSQARNTKPFFVMMVDCSTSSVQTLPTTASGIMWCIYRPVSSMGDYIINRLSSSRLGYVYGIVDYMYIASSSSTTTSRMLLDESSTGLSVDTYLTTSGFTPSMQSTSRYWRKDRTYKWVAVWDTTS